VLSPGVIVRAGAVVRESILLTDSVVESGAVIERTILDKRVQVGEGAHVGGGVGDPNIRLTMVGKNSSLPPGLIVESGAEIRTDVSLEDFEGSLVKMGPIIRTKRQPYEI